MGLNVGGESIYGGVFPDEFHSRLRFNHRGIVAMANAGSSHSNGSQFFITLDKCEGLDRKHTIFGKVMNIHRSVENSLEDNLLTFKKTFVSFQVTGDSIFNLMRIGEVDTDKNDWPLDPAPKICSVEVSISFFGSEIWPVVKFSLSEILW